MIKQIQSVQFEDDFLLQKNLSLHKEVILQISSEEKYYGNLKWSGIVDGYACGGVELIIDCELGTDGTFSGIQLFRCKNKRGVVIPIHYITSDDRVFNPQGINQIAKAIDQINMTQVIKQNTDSLSNNLKVSSENNTISKPQLNVAAAVLREPNREDQLKSIVLHKFKRIKENSSFLEDEELTINCPVIIQIHDQKFQGILKWCGMIDYVGSAGIELNDTFGIATDGTFQGIKLFSSKSGRGVMVPLKYVEYDHSRDTRVTTANDSMCVICEDEGKNFAFVPCGHMVGEVCAQKLNVCPFCSAPIERKLKVFS